MTTINALVAIVLQAALAIALAVIFIAAVVRVAKAYRQRDYPEVAVALIVALLVCAVFYNWTPTRQIVNDGYSQTIGVVKDKQADAARANK